MDSNDLAYLASLVEHYLEGQFTQFQLLHLLQAVEGPAWHFTLDPDRLLVRTDVTKAVFKWEGSQPGQRPFTVSIVDMPDLIDHSHIQQVRRQIAQTLGARTIIAFCGSARVVPCLTLLRRLVERAFHPLCPAHHAVLTGGYAGGVPLLAAQVAQQHRLPTIAIAPRVLTTLGITALLEEMYSHVILEGDDWGDESYLLIGVADVVVIIEGGYWTALEMRYAQALGKPVVHLQPNVMCEDDLQWVGEAVVQALQKAR